MNSPILEPILVGIRMFTAACQNGRNSQPALCLSTSSQVPHLVPLLELLMLPTPKQIKSQHPACCRGFNLQASRSFPRIPSLLKVGQVQRFSLKFVREARRAKVVPKAVDDDHPWPVGFNGESARFLHGSAGTSNRRHVFSRDLGKDKDFFVGWSLISIW